MGGRMTRQTATGPLVLAALIVTALPAGLQDALDTLGDAAEAPDPPQHRERASATQDEPQVVSGDELLPDGAGEPGATESVSDVLPLNPCEVGG